MPLRGLRVLEFAGLGAAPFATSLLAQAGADVLRLDRPGGTSQPPAGRTTVQVDLKSAEGQRTAQALARNADVLIEGFRPGVMERLGLGPEPLLADNAALVYGRMTGWGQDGPRAAEAGHDINYLALTGTLDALGRQGHAPTPPLNLVGDYGGGLLLAFGVMLALHERQRSGRGQVIDAAMVDAGAVLSTGVWRRRAAGTWQEGARGCNDIDSGAPFYDAYETSDGRYMAVGSIEPRFYRALVSTLGLDPEQLPDQWDRSAWPRTKLLIRGRFLRRTQAEWESAFAEVDACVTPVRTFTEALADPHVQARSTLVTSDGQPAEPAPAPRLSRSPLGHPTATPTTVDPEAALIAWGAR